MHNFKCIMVGDALGWRKYYSIFVLFGNYCLIISLKKLSRKLLFNCVFCFVNSLYLDLVYFQFFFKIDTVALSSIFDKYCPIVD